MDRAVGLGDLWARAPTDEKVEMFMTFHKRPTCLQQTLNFTYSQRKVGLSTLYRPATGREIFCDLWDRRLETKLARQGRKGFTSWRRFRA